MASFPTPKYSHLSQHDFERLYEPAEDTFLMLDAIEKDIQIIQSIEPLICLEVGPGSGIIITFLATILGPKIFYFASDKNNHASISTKKCGIENKVNINVCTDDLISSLKSRLKGSVDILLFNPPYVVTPSAEVGGTSLSSSWAGGENGRQVIDQFLPIATELVSAKGMIYLLVIKENNPDEIMDLMKSFGFESNVVIQRRTGPEYLSVLRFSRCSDV